MIGPLREAFNAAWTSEAYADYGRRLAEAAGSRIGFRLCETPVFLPPELRDAMVRGAVEIWDQLSTAEALERSRAAVPAEFDVPGSDAHPLFAQADFAVVADEGGRLVPRLIELQGFPSLSAFDGESGNGQWRLFVQNDSASANAIGKGFSLDITQQPAPPSPPAPPNPGHRKEEPTWTFCAR